MHILSRKKVDFDFSKISYQNMQIGVESATLNISISLSPKGVEYVFVIMLSQAINLMQQICVQTI